jgi:hypothetical protein
VSAIWSRVRSSASSAGDTAAPTETAGTEEPTAEPSYELHTVEPPDSDVGILVGDDMLIVGSDTIPEELIEEILQIQIRGEDAIYAHEVISLGQTATEGEVYDVAAVDIPGYRRFTDLNTAHHEEGWQRIAGGEFAANHQLQGALPLDDDGYMAIGSGAVSHLVHAGAYAKQAAGFDIVVNRAWGEALGLPQGNAMLISTGSFSPQAVRPRLEKVLGDDYSIQDLDAVAQFGLDPDAFNVVRPVGTFADAVGVFRYTPLGDGRIQPDPAWVAEYIVTDTVPILGRVTCNKHMMPQLKAALAEVVESGLAHEINYHVGCYHPRFIANSTQLSNHSFGLAIDINSLENQRGTRGQMHRGVVAIFKKWGFAWGGDWHYTDPMHFELERIVNPG